jgi:hypothetical protein
MASPGDRRTPAQSYEGRTHQPDSGRGLGIGDELGLGVGDELGGGDGLGDALGDALGVGAGDGLGLGATQFFPFP